jgi:16S rRNA processing protein RimM
MEITSKSPAKPDYKLVGKIKEAHGLRGEFYVLIFSGDSSWLSEITELQFRNPQNNEIHTFKKLKARAFKKGLIVSVEGVSDRTQAEKYHGFTFWIPESLFVTKPGETIYLSEIANFMIHDPQGKLLGQIVGFSTNGAQDLLIVQTEKNKSEIPFVAPFIKEINFEKKWIMMDLPEGLLNIEDL